MLQEPRVVYFGRKNQDANSKPVKAGTESFNLRLKLDKPFDATTSIGFNFQRLVWDPGGYVVTKAISDADTTYFVAGNSPSGQISFARGEVEKVIGPIKVQADAEQGGTPVDFPDDILFTATVPGGSENHISHVVTVVK
jgi:hypothetical protein